MPFASKKSVAVAVLAILLLGGFTPLIGFADDDHLYVDGDASSGGDGSIDDPFDSIQDALDEADEDTQVHVAPGTYEESIDIPEEVEVYGTDAKEVIIISEDDDEPTVRMRHKTALSNVTVQGGYHGIRVSDKSRVSITNCIIKDNDKDGIRVKYSSSVKDKYAVNIVQNEIYSNGRSGLYAEKSRILLIENQIYDNDSDGVDLDYGVSAWIYKNRFKDNDASGLKLALDKSEIWTKNNTFRDNKREGLEINYRGAYGRIDINKAKFYENDRYGVARVHRGAFSQDGWNNVTFRGEVLFHDNASGDMSHVIIKY